MKKTTKLAILLLVVNLSANGQNLLTNPGFESDPTTYTVSNELWRVAYFYDDATQTTSPTKDPAADISAGGVWIKKHPNSGYFKATVSTTTPHSDTKCLNMKIGAGSSQTGMGDWTNMVNLQRISSVSNSRIYKASVWARVDATSTNACSSITLFITDNTLRTNLTSTITLTGGTTWTKYETTFDIPTFVAANPTANFATAFFGVGITTTYDGTSKTNYSGVLLDDYSLEAVTTPTDYFRSSASGNWSDLSTWQSSFDNTTWINSTLIPTSEAASINIQSGHEVAIDVAATASSLIVNAGGKLTLNASESLTTNALNIESSGSGTGTFVDKGGTLTIYSTNNLLQNPGFETAPAGYTVSNELWRVGNFQDNATQTSNPTMSAATDVSAGGIWIKKHANTGYLKSKIITTDKKTGTYSLNMYIPATTPSSLSMENWYNLVNLQRITVPLSNSKKYRATVWARADATVGNVCDKITFFLTDNTNKVNLTSIVNLTGGTTWTQYEAIFDVPTFVAANPTSDFSTAFFGIGIQSTLQSGDNTKYNYSGIILDNYTLTELTNTASVNQYLNAARNWYISSPMSNATAPAGYTYYKYHEAGDNVDYSAPATAFWEAISTGSTLNVGTGYIAKLASGTATFNFSGILNTGNKSVTLTRTGNNGFNLVGNPYPSFLYIDDLQSNADLESSYWIRSYNSGYVFDTYNIPSAMSTGLSGLSLTSKIPPMQAFWLRVKEGSTSASVTFTNTMRFHQDDANNKFRTPKSSNTDRQVVRLQVSNGLRTDETILYAQPEASNQHDRYDSEKMSNNSVSIPEIYTLAGDEQLAINGLNSIPYNVEIPLGFKTGETNTFTLKASQFTNFAAETQIILKDYLIPNNVTEYDLSDGSSYSFSSEAVSTVDRFRIMFKSPAFSTDNQLLNQNESGKLHVYKNGNNKIIVNYNGEIFKRFEVSIYNALGQQLANKVLINSTLEFENNFSKGVYTVKLTNAKMNLSKKIVVD